MIMMYDIVDGYNIEDVVDDKKTMVSFSTPAQSLQGRHSCTPRHHSYNYHHHHHHYRNDHLSSYLLSPRSPSYTVVTFVNLVVTVQDCAQCSVCWY